MILKTINPKVVELLSEIERLGFSLCLVGGAVRDFELFGSVGNDLDFEIRPSKKNLSENEWCDFYQKLIKLFNDKQFAVTKHPYLITKISYLGHDLEFSSPRIEKQINDNYTHHHFEAKLSGDLTYEQSFKRRDVTINAMGAELDLQHETEKRIDPFAGNKDLQNKVLRHCSDDFFSDPVRFFRLVRFSVKYNFSICDSTRKQLSHFNLSQLSVHYLKQEAFKSKNAGAFFNLAKFLMQENQLSLNTTLSPFFTLDYPEELKSIEEVVAFALIQDHDLGSSLAKIFSFSEKFIRDIESFQNNWLTLSKLSQSELKTFISQDYQSITDTNLLKSIKSLHEKKDYLFLCDYLVRPHFDWKKFVEVPFVNDDLNNQANYPEKMRSFLKYFLKLKREMR